MQQAVDAAQIDERAEVAMFLTVPLMTWPMVRPSSVLRFSSSR